MTSQHQYDVIFAGGKHQTFILIFVTHRLRYTGGTASCVVASRLATADPSLKILVIEAGAHTLNEISHIQPARYIHNLMPGSKTTQFVVSNVSEHLDGRAVAVPVGHCLGGGSSVNCEEKDYDMSRCKLTM